MPAFVDLTGQRFGRWYVMSEAGRNKHGAAMWLCKCNCGNEKIVPSKALRSGQSQSCGCLNVDVHRKVCVERNSTHRKSKTETYDVWTNMLSRCRNPNATAYHKYGAKGITVCERWSSFENFLADMGERPSKKFTIDRINSLGNYEPTNCRWATMCEQQNNRTNNRLITLNGVTKTMADWARYIGISRNTIMNRLNRGLPANVVLSATRHCRWNPLPK